MSDKRFTSSHIEIPPYLKNYTPSSKEETPGQYPFTRGVHESMYRKRPWTMRQYAGLSTASESNKRYRELLKNGAKGLSVAFDLPTQMGHDSDYSLALGEVGKVGVAIDTIEDMRILFDGIDLSQVSTSMTINSTAPILLALYQSVAEEKGIDSTKLRGTVQNDILKEYIARGTYIYAPEDSLRLVTNVFEYCHQHMPKFNTISISGYHIREAGSTAAQELAFTLANGMVYVEKALSVGLDIDEFAPRLSFFFNVHNNFIEEIAKFRAARRMWAKIVKERFGAKNEKSMKLRFHSQVAGSTLTAQSPYNNIMRVTLQAMASVLGGTQSLHTNAYDEALQLPTPHSATLALRTQQVIAHESGVCDFVDPMAGSFAIESLTDQLEEKAQEYIQTIEDQGGVIQSLDYIKNQISEAAYKAQLKVERKENIVVGVNEFIDDDNDHQVESDVDIEIEKDQIKRLKSFKEKRDQKKVDKFLSDLKLSAKKDDNLMPMIKSCVQNSCTLGEVSNALREVFQKY